MRSYLYIIKNFCIYSIVLLTFWVASTQPCMAKSDSWLQKGIQAYNNLEFTQAIGHLKAYLKTQPDKSNRIKALRYLALCYHSNGQKKPFVDTWKQAVLLDPKVKVPAGQSPSVIEQFERVRKSVLHAKHAKHTIRKRPVVRRQPNVQKRVRPQRRRTVRIINRRTPPPPKAGFKHTASLIVLSVGVLSAGGAAASGYASQQAFIQSEQATDLQPLQTSRTLSTTSTILWISGGTFVAAGLGILIWEATRPPSPPKIAHQHTKPVSPPQRAMVLTTGTEGL